MSTLTPPPNPTRQVVEEAWPDAHGRGPRLVGVAAAVGILAAVVLPKHNFGLGTALVFAAACATVFLGSKLGDAPRRWLRLDAIDVGLVALLISMLVLRDAAWITVLCLIAALAVVAINSTRATTAVAMVASAVAVPFAGVRGMPWLVRTLRPTKSRTAWLPVLRTAAVSVVLLLVFGALFASADALFASWVDAITPDLTWGETPARVLVALAVGGVTLAAAFVNLAPPRVDRLAIPVRRSQNRLEWVVPVVVVNVVFALFLIAQAAVLFGGHAYLRRTTGLTYADYVHQGFGQLTVVTILTLTLVAWVAHTAEPGRLRNLVLGPLCVMAIIVVVSALHRMRLYEDAYGYTRLRLLVSVFEGWLGVVLLLVLVAGVRGGRWVTPAAVRLGAVSLLGLALLNPDLYIAKHNLARDTTSVAIDWEYLSDLSGDAYPAFADLPADDFSCLRHPGRFGHDNWLEFNVGRHRAATLLAEPPESSHSETCAPAQAGASIR